MAKKEEQKTDLLDQRIEEANHVIHEHLDDLQEMIEVAISEACEQYAVQFANTVVSKLLNGADHYAWKPTYGYDYSGEVESDGKITVDSTTTVRDYLDEYTGSWEPSYISGHGKDWRTVDDDLFEDVTNLADEVYVNVFETFLSENGFEDLVDNDDVHIFDFVERLDRDLDLSIPDIFETIGISDDTSLFNFLRMYTTNDEALDTYIARADEKEEEARKKEAEEKAKAIAFSKKIPENYADLYPFARTIKRHFVIHLGPTNSGKTHDAIEAMRRHESGVYLAPLRLLAAEQQESLTNDGYPCNLKTGEEEQTVQDAKYLAATVEMADFRTEIKCAVIDECQMVSDPDRGGAWTAAIMGLPAKEMHLCAAPYAENILIRLIELCGDSYEVVRNERKTPLVVETGSYNFPQDAQKGDAFIVFSRRNVHAVGAELQKAGKKVSIIYGMLPPAVRHQQAEDFRTGKTDVLVSTDAIGMGMNLPIRRIVFLEQSKYDGEKNRTLTTEETLQIAGRAGRYGVYDTGFVTSFGGRKMLRNTMQRTPKDIAVARIDFPPVLIDDSVSKAVTLWRKDTAHIGFTKAYTDTLLQLAKKAEEYVDDPKLVYSLATIPFDVDNENLYEIWKQGVLQMASGTGNVFSYLPQVEGRGALGYLEEAFREADLLYVFADRFGYTEEKDKITNLKEKISEKIIEQLSTKQLASRKCKYCGKPLAWNYPYGMCSDCYDQRYGYRSRWDDDDYYDW